MNTAVIHRQIPCCVAYVFMVALLMTSLAADDKVDSSLFPDAYGILGTEKYLFPVALGDWPVRVDGSRQLFVDDYLIKSIDGVTREFHKLKRHPSNPLWTPPRRIGLLYSVLRTESGRFQLWYMQRIQAVNEDGKKRRYPTGYLESDDGVHWRAPSLGVVSADGSKDNNYVFEKSLDGVVYTPWEEDASKRYKGLVHFEPSNDKTDEPLEGYWLYVSPDGIRWRRERGDPVAVSLIDYKIPQSGIGDTSSFRWDRKLKRFICNTKFVLPGKYRAYGISESDDLIHWSPPRMMFYRDAFDPEGMEFYAHTTFDYESMWFGLVKTMEISQPERAGGKWKHCELQLSLSRDGRHFTRCADRSPFLPVPESLDAFDMDYPCVPSGVPIRMGDELWFYYADRRHQNRPGAERDTVDMRLFLATLRVDGFASLNAGERPGVVVTRPLTYAGKTLYVNADVAPGGSIRCELRRFDGQVVESHSFGKSQPVRGDTFRGKLTWVTSETLPPTRQTGYRLALELTKAKLYSFWIAEN
ncbi:MAG: hypothetical protein MK538_00130 [Planctomycetes bacterium]|nr:hypothetical protein [Planctomycetota bacterium]